MHGTRVWSTSLDRRADSVERMRTLLDRSELARADQFRFEEHRRRFIVSRATLRTLLAELTGTSPERIAIETLANGKPYLAGQNATSPLFFNVSHSGDRALFAFADCEVGIDIERVSPQRDLDRIAANFFAPDERKQLDDSPDDQKTDCFYRTWVRKEAYLKATGDGFSADPATVTVDPRYTIIDLPDVDDYVAAIALSSVPNSTLCFSRPRKASVATEIAASPPTTARASA